VNEFLIQRIINQPRGLAAQLALGLGVAGLSLAICWALRPILGGATPFIAFMPAVLVASVFGGARAGAVCVVACALFGGLVFFGSGPGAPPPQRRLLGEITFLTTGALIVWIASLTREALLRALDAQEAERLLAAELQHRVKNTLGVVQALASQTLRHAPDAESLKRDFNDRLMALAEAHNVLGGSGWDEATLEDLATRALAPFHGGRPERIVLSGPELRLPADHAVSLALCLHELATNAMKYGALSSDAGRVRVAWAVEQAGAGRRARVSWDEHDGPPVTPPSRRGFGAELLARSVSNRARPSVTHEFPPDGVKWTVTFDLDGPKAG
jgi:two-component sensor histidine kinase